MTCSCGHLNVSEVILTECMIKGDKRFYNALYEDKDTLFDLLFMRGDAKALHILSTEYGLKPDIRGVESEPLLHQLAAGGYTTLLQELISKFNYDPASSDKDGNTILHSAAQHGQYEIAEFIVTNYSNQLSIARADCSSPCLYWWSY